MFHEDHGFRDLLMFGSVVLMALATMPVTRAAADEVYVCSDGRTLRFGHDEQHRRWNLGPHRLRQ